MDLKPETVIAGTISLQQYQPCTEKELQEYLKELGFKERITGIRWLLQNLQARGLASKTYKDNETAYKLSNPLFKNVPETAQLKDILPTLVKSKEAQELLKVLEGESSDTKKGRTPTYGKPKKVAVTLELTEPALGTHNGKKEGTRIWRRNGKGEIIIGRNMIYALIRDGLRLLNKTGSIAQYCFPSIGRVKMNGNKPEQIPLEIMRGICTYEALPRGTEIEFSVIIPSTVLPTEKFKEMLETMSENCARGIGAYGRSHGDYMLKEFKVM